MNDMHRLADRLAAEAHFIEGVTRAPTPLDLELKARELCQERLGDPNALDRNGNPRWKWFIDKAREVIAKATGATS